MYQELQQSANIEKANECDEELKTEYGSMTDDEKALKDAVDLVCEKYDENKDGMLNFKEFTKWLNDVQDSNIDHEKEKKQFGTIDTDTNNFISKRELFEFLK